MSKISFDKIIQYKNLILLIIGITVFISLLFTDPLGYFTERAHQRAKIENQIAIERAETEKQISIIKAQTEAELKKINAEN